MRVIPVLDIQHGTVVRGVAGRRDEYRPISSPLTRSSAPLDVASAFIERFALREQYLADLDAICRCDPNWETYSAVRGAGVALMVDAGLRCADDARRMAEFAQAPGPGFSIVAALETLPDLDTLTSILDIATPERLVFSIDIKQGRLLCGPGWRATTPLDVAREAIRVGVRRLIVLDLARVGVGEGVGTEPLCRRLSDERPDVELIAGGGVRGVDDLLRLADAGCSAALVASALHDGRLSANDIAAVRQRSPAD